MSSEIHMFSKHNVSRIDTLFTPSHSPSPFKLDLLPSSRKKMISRKEKEEEKEEKKEEEMKEEEEGKKKGRKEEGRK